MPGLFPIIDRPILKLGTALNAVSDAIDVAGCANLAFYIIGNGAVGAGAVQIEESHDVAYTGTWAALGAATTVVANSVAAPIKLAGTAKAVRARISTAVTGGTVTVYLVGR